MIYKGKQLTVVQTEMLVRILIDPKYVPPAGSVAAQIWMDNNWFADDVWKYIDKYVKNRPR